jgi:hypothetical protein
MDIVGIKLKLKALDEEMNQRISEEKNDRFVFLNDRS